MLSKAGGFDLPWASTLRPFPVVPCRCANGVAWGGIWGGCLALGLFGGLSSCNGHYLGFGGFFFFWGGGG